MGNTYCLAFAQWKRCSISPLQSLPSCYLTHKIPEIHWVFSPVPRMCFCRNPILKAPHLKFPFNYFLYVFDISSTASSHLLKWFGKKVLSLKLRSSLFSEIYMKHNRIKLNLFNKMCVILLTLKLSLGANFSPKSLSKKNPCQVKL